MTRRDVMTAGAAIGASALAGGPLRALADTPAAPAAWSGGGVRSHGESLIGGLKYGPDFSRFDYVNANAPKGGSARLSVSGRFDNLNPFIQVGQPAGSVALIYDRLMEPSFDEGSTQYCLLSEWFEQPEDYSWAAFKVRDDARWHDGTPVTAADVVFSIDTFKTKASPRYQFYYADVEGATDEGDNIVVFRFKVSGNRELPHIMGQLDVLPQHWWAERDFTAALLETPLGSGPYRLTRVEEGRLLEYQRVDDYWGADHPTKVGKHNFETLTFEYFQDRDIAFESFKAGRIEYWNENSAGRWAQRYDFPAMERGDVSRAEPVLEGPKRVQYFAYNLRREKFADRRVREAIGLAFDFEDANRRVYFEQYARPRSFFQGTPNLMATGLPNDAERALLEPFRDALPPALFDEEFAYPVNDGRRGYRRTLRRATALLEEAGYRIERGVLLDPGGAPVELEFLTAQAAQRAVIDPYLDGLGALGVQTSLRTVDVTQYLNRLRNHDFDVVIFGVANSESPGNEQRDYWGSVTADLAGTRNIAGVRSPVVDALIDAIIFAEDRLALETASKALDRVLLWEHYTVLQLYTPFERIAYWNRLTPPDPLPPRAIGFPDVWWSADA